MNEQIVDVIGWTSSLVLIPSLGYQTFTQWKERTSKGVSVTLYLGSLISSVGFTVYSWHLDNMVFLVSNALLVVNNVVGLSIHFRFRKK